MSPRRRPKNDPKYICSHAYSKEYPCDCECTMPLCGREKEESWHCETTNKDVKWVRYKIGN